MMTSLPNNDRLGYDLPLLSGRREWLREHYVSHVWRLGTAASRLALTRRGFNARETERLIAFKIRYERRDLRFVSDEEKRLRFARWLVTHGYLTDQLVTRETEARAA